MELTGTPNRDGIPVIENYAGPGQNRVVLRRKLSLSSRWAARLSYGTWFEEIVVHRNFEDGCARNRHVAV